MLFESARPVVLNGIEEVINRPDLADRAIFLTLGPVSEKWRRPEKALWREFELQRPKILGAMLDIAAHGLRTCSDVRIEKWPRMADFALWSTACETAHWSPGTFGHAYSANRRAAIEGSIDADPVAAYVLEIMAARNSWTGTAADLLSVSVDRGSARISAEGTRWPRSPRALAGRCVAPKPVCVHWASTFRSAAKVEPEAGLLGCERRRTASAWSAWSGIVTPLVRTRARETGFVDDVGPPVLSARGFSFPHEGR